MREVAKLEDLIAPYEKAAKIIYNSEVRTSNFKDSFIARNLERDGERLMYDIWYKRILTDILLYRERQIPYLSREASEI